MPGSLQVAGWALRTLGEAGAALDRFQQALAVYRGDSDRAGEATR
jgi:hypothetical protein